MGNLGMSSIDEEPVFANAVHRNSSAVMPIGQRVEDVLQG